jgi:hypothetical protein
MRDVVACRAIRSGWLPLAAAAAALVAPGCGPSPTSPSGLLPPSGPILISLIITGNPSLSAIGQTTQLAALASYSDRSTRDVTRESEWRSTDPSVVTVSATGLVTVVGFGVGRVEVTFGSRAANPLPISVWPPGLFAVSGRVREPGQGGILNVRVLDAATGLSTTTAGDGGFFLGGIAGPELTFESTSFETARVAVRPNDSLDVAMQRVIRITAGDRVHGQLAPHDVSYELEGERCYPCRLIRVLVAMPATLRFHLTWSGPRTALYIWAAGRRFDGTHPELTVDLPVPAGEFVVYMGMKLPPSAAGATDYVPFTLTTEFR